MKIHPADVSKQNSNGEKQIILLMISNGWHYITVKKLPALLEEQRQNTMIFLLPELSPFFCNKSKLKWHKKVCAIKDFWDIVSSSENIKVFQFNQYRKSDKAPFIVSAGLEWLKEKIFGCKNCFWKFIYSKTR